MKLIRCKILLFCLLNRQMYEICIIRFMVWTYFGRVVLSILELEHPESSRVLTRCCSWLNIYRSVHISSEWLSEDTHMDVNCIRSLSSLPFPCFLLSSLSFALLRCSKSQMQLLLPHRHVYMNHTNLSLY